MKPLRAGVVGAGVFGGYHARKYAELEGVTLTAIFDPDLSRAQALAAKYGAEPHEDLREFLGGIDIVTIATPAVSHYDLAREAIAAGKGVYVEKPITATLEEADRLVLAADRAGVILACGHQERVSFAAMGLLGLEERPIELSAVRLGPPSDRSRDVSCVLDLMIHDLDLALQLTEARVCRMV